MDTQAQVFELYRQGHSLRKIALTLNMCRRTVRRYLKKRDRVEAKETKFSLCSNGSINIISTEETGLAAAVDFSTFNQDLPSQIVEPECKALPPETVIVQFPSWFQNLDWKYLLNEKRKGVPVLLLYQEIELKDVKYWTFWNNLSRLDKILSSEKPKTTMRLIHKPGEKTFVDYGDGILIEDPLTGTKQKTWIFVGSLPFSSKVYAEFVLNQKLPSFIASHEKMWKFFGGITKYIVSDNLKSAVTTARLYDPDVNQVFVSYANHCGFAVLPARPRRPKDKANVETHVGLLQRTFFQEVRHKSFSSLGELNQILSEFLIKFNNKIMKEYGISRNDRFAEEKNFLQPLPESEFILPEVKEVSVHPDCHVQFGKSFYSVPWEYVGKKVRVIGTNRVQIFNLLSLERIALHPLSLKDGGRITNPLHWPSEKYEHCEFNMEKANRDARLIGPKTEEMILFLFSLPHPLVYLRRVQSWLRSVSQGKITKNAMEYAATMARQHEKFSSAYVKNCAEHFDSTGLGRVQKSGAPKRELNHLYLHK